MFINIFGHFRNIAGGLRAPWFPYLNVGYPQRDQPQGLQSLANFHVERRWRVPFSAFISVSLFLSGSSFLREFICGLGWETLYVRMRRTAVPEIIVRSLDARATCRMKNYKCASVTSSFSHLHDVTLRRVKPPPHAASRHKTTLSKASCEIKTFRTLRRKIVAETLQVCRHEIFVQAAIIVQLWGYTNHLSVSIVKVIKLSVRIKYALDIKLIAVAILQIWYPIM